MGDSDFDVAWRAFAEDDAQAKAPSGVGRAVMAAWDAANEDRSRTWSGRRRYLVSAVAALLIIAGRVALREDAQEPDRAGPVPLLQGPETASTSVPVRGADADPNPARPQAAIEAAPPVPRASSQLTESPGAIIRLIADPTFETESLEIVRLRLPRTSLEAFGIALVEPDASSLVEVDVLVGDDGLPRDIRRIRTVVDLGILQ